MNLTSTTSSDADKQLTRDLIERQIEDYLQRGGEIQILEGAASQYRHRRASVWQSRDELTMAAD